MTNYPDRNLTSVKVKDGYPNLAQNRFGVLTDGLGNSIDNITVTSSWATSASHASMTDILPVGAAIGAVTVIGGATNFGLSSGHGNSIQILDSNDSIAFNATAFTFSPGDITANNFHGQADTAITASFVTSSNIVGKVSSAINADTASFALNGGGSGTTLFTASLYQITASWVQTASFFTEKATFLTTASLYQITASWSQTSSVSTTASFALNSSGTSTTLFTASIYQITSSWSQNSQTASFVTLSQTSSFFVEKATFLTTASLYQITSSWSQNSQTASFVITAQTASFFVEKATFLTTASLYQITSSWSQTASFFVEKATFLSTGSLYQITSSWSQTASVVTLSQTSSFVTLAQTASFALSSPATTLFTASLYQITSSWSQTTSQAQTASFITLAQTASFFVEKATTLFTASLYQITSSWAQTSSFVLNGGGSGTTLFTASTYQITSSWANSLTSITNAGVPLFDNISTIPNYTLTQSFDQNRVLTFTTNSLVTLPNTFPVGWSCLAMQTGTGQVQFTQSFGGTLVNRQNLTKTAGQWAVASLLVYSSSSANSSSWVLGGDVG